MSKRLKSLKNPSQDQLYFRIIETTKQILKEAEGLSPPPLTDAELKVAFSVSKQACDQQDFVPMRPIMRNAMVRHGDLQSKKDKLPVDAPLTTAEKVIHDRMVKMAIRTNGPEVHDYDVHLPLLDARHYNVDVWNNLKDNMRDVGPGQRDKREELVKEFSTKPDTAWLIEKLETDPILKKAVLMIYDLMPAVAAYPAVDSIQAPFEKKHTHNNVGKLRHEIGWGNSRSTEKTTGEKFSKLAARDAKNLTFKTIYEMNVSTAFGRDQRLKGRLLIALNRAANLFLARLENAEIEQLKSNPLFTGYNNVEVLKKNLLQYARWCEDNNCVMANFDQSAFDLHINPVFIALIGAMRREKCVGALAKNIAFARAVLNIRTWLVDGMSDQVVEVWGRMFSGLIDTNQGNGWISAIINLYVLMMIMSNYSKLWACAVMKMFVMGDDSLVFYILDKFTKEKWIQGQASLGFETNMAPGKYQFGPYFLQYRLFEQDGNTYMIYPWTRVVKSLCFTENSKQLGPYGWIAAQLQQLAKLIEYPPALDAAIWTLLPYEKYRFGYGMSGKQLVDKIKLEDVQASADKPPSRVMSTADFLYDGDPQKSDMFTSEGELDPQYFDRILVKVTESVDRVSGLTL